MIEQSNLSKDKVTIVTVVYNGEQEIEDTIKSIVEQTYKNIEYIVIDGASNDNTVSIIKRYDDKIDYWVSEKDNGIYDAMNKAIDLATGDWINFMNAGDTFASHDILEKVFTQNDVSDYDVIYGNNYYKGDNFLKKQIARNLNILYKGMAFNHQSSFIKLSIIKKYKFDPIWRIQCEYDLFMKLYLNNYKFKHVNEVVAIYRDGGFSEQNTVERTIERWLINLRYKTLNIDVDTINRHYHSLLNSSIGMDSTRTHKQKFKSKIYLNKFIKKLIK